MIIIVIISKGIFYLVIMRVLGQLMTIGCCGLAGVLWSASDQKENSSDKDPGQQQNGFVYVYPTPDPVGVYPFWGYPGIYEGGVWGPEYYGHPYYYNNEWYNAHRQHWNHEDHQNRQRYENRQKGRDFEGSRGGGGNRGGGRRR